MKERKIGRIEGIISINIFKMKHHLKKGAHQNFEKVAKVTGKYLSLVKYSDYFEAHNQKYRRLVKIYKEENRFD